MLIQLIGFSLTKLFIGFGAGAPAWFLTSELVSPKITSTCQSISTGALLMATGLITLLFISVDQWIGTWSIFVLAAVPATILAITLALFLPETRERSYEEIRRDLSGRTFSGLKSRVKEERNGLLNGHCNGYMNGHVDLRKSYGSLKEYDRENDLELLY